MVLKTCRDFLLQGTLAVSRDRKSSRPHLGDVLQAPSGQGPGMLLSWGAQGVRLIPRSSTEGHNLRGHTAAERTRDQTACPPDDSVGGRIF